jgi:hypothetical protein
MNWLSMAIQAAGQLITRLPLEKLITKPVDNRQRLEELREILGESHTGPASLSEPGESQELPEPKLQPKVHLAIAPQSGVSQEETVAYQNREIVKIMRDMVKHCVHKFRIFGRPCDCGQFKHILELEALAEETVPMVDNPDIYYRIIETGKELEPKTTLEAIGSGKYDEEYPRYARVYRDFCKALGFDEGIDLKLIEKPEPGQYFPEEVKANE